MVRWTLNRFVQACGAAALIGAGSGYASLIGAGGGYASLSGRAPPPRPTLADARPAAPPLPAPSALAPPAPILPAPPLAAAEPPVIEPPRGHTRAEARHIAAHLPDAVRVRHERVTRWAARTP